MRAWRFANLITALALGLPLAQAQDPSAAPAAEEPQPAPPARPDERGTREGRGRHADGAEPTGERGFWMALREWPMRPTKEDESPLRPGEEAELMDFAKAQLPPLFQDLSQFRERNPEGFARRFGNLAPRLRFLRRIVTKEPAAGGAMLAHLRGQFQVERVRRALSQGLGPNPPKAFDRERAERMLREALSRAAQAEVDILRVQADWLEKSRDEIADERIAGFVAPGANLATHAPQVRQMIQELREARAARDAATTAEVRDAQAQRAAEIEQQMRAVIGRRVDEDARARRARADEQEAALTETVDRRFEQIIESAQNAANAPRGTGDGKAGKRERDARSGERPPAPPTDNGG